MSIEKADRRLSDDREVLPNLATLRTIALTEPIAYGRRRTPRRQTVSAVAVERRQADRRVSRPGIDGLVRQVLADDWR